MCPRRRPPATRAWGSPKWPPALPWPTVFAHRRADRPAQSHWPARYGTAPPTGPGPDRAADCPAGPAQPETTVPVPRPGQPPDRSAPGGANCDAPSLQLPAEGAAHDAPATRPLRAYGPTTGQVAAGHQGDRP